MSSHLSGLGGALEFLRFRGRIGKQAQRYLGRNKDENPESYMAKFGESKNDSVQLDYHNEVGEKLTMKQAFRMMCWKFHGMKPSKRQQEKILKKKQNATRLEKQAPTGSLL